MDVNQLEPLYSLKETTSHHNGNNLWVNIFQSEITIEICSNGLIRAMGKFLLIKNRVEPH